MKPLSDPAAERAVLAAVFNHGHDAYFEVIDVIQANTFTIDSNLAFWKCLHHILKDDMNAKPDLPTVLSVAKTLGYDDLFSLPEERKHLRAITQLQVELVNVRKLAGKIRKLHIARELQATLSGAHDILGDVTGEEAVDTILGMAQNPVSDYICKNSETEQDESVLGDGLDEYLDYLEANPVDQIGISSGWRHFDKANGGGFRPGALTVIAARMKVGKSQVGMNMCNNVATIDGIPVWYGDTELRKKDHWNRLLANLGDVIVDEIETGQYSLDPVKKDKVRLASKALKVSPYTHAAIAGRPFEETMARMRRWVMKKVGLDENGKAKPCLFVFDYLKLMDSGELGKDLREYQVMGFMMTALHNFAVKYEVPIVVLVQLNRDGIDGEETNAIGGSDRIGMLCSSMWFLKWQSPEEKAEQFGAEARYSHKLVYICGRHGKGLPKEEYIHMLAEYEDGRLTEGPLRSELNKADNQKSKGFEVEVGDDEVVDFANGA